MCEVARGSHPESDRDDEPEEVKGYQGHQPPAWKEVEPFELALGMYSVYVKGVWERWTQDDDNGAFLLACEDEKERFIF